MKYVTIFSAMFAMACGGGGFSQAGTVGAGGEGGENALDTAGETGYIENTGGNASGGSGGVVTGGSGGVVTGGTGGDVSGGSGGDVSGGSGGVGGQLIDGVIYEHHDCPPGTNNDLCENKTGWCVTVPNGWGECHLFSGEIINGVIYLHEDCTHSTNLCENGHGWCSNAINQLGECRLFAYDNWCNYDFFTSGQCGEGQVCKSLDFSPAGGECCTPKTCADFPGQCGHLDDGCDRSIDCPCADQ